MDNLVCEQAFGLLATWCLRHLGSDSDHTRGRWIYQNRKATHIHEYIFVIVSLNHTYLTTKMNKAVRCYLWWVTFATLNFSSVSWVADLPAGIDLCKPNENMSKYVLVQWHWKIHRLYLHFLFSHCHWYKAIRWKSDPKKLVTCYITLPKARSVGHGATWEADKMLSKLRLSYLKPRGSLNFVWWWHIANVMNRTWPPLTTALLKWRVYNIPWIYPNEACMRPFYIMYYHFAHACCTLSILSHAKDRTLRGMRSDV